MRTYVLCVQNKIRLSAAEEEEKEPEGGPSWLPACLPTCLSGFVLPPPSFPRDRVSVSMSLMPSSFPPSATNLPHVVRSLPARSTVAVAGRPVCPLPPHLHSTLCPSQCPINCLRRPLLRPSGLPLSRSLRSRYSVGTEAQKIRNSNRRRRRN